MSFLQVKINIKHTSSILPVSYILSNSKIWAFLHNHKNQTLQKLEVTKITWLASYTKLYVIQINMYRIIYFAHIKYWYTLLKVLLNTYS